MIKLSECRPTAVAYPYPARRSESSLELAWNVIDHLERPHFLSSKNHLYALVAAMEIIPAAFCICKAASNMFAGYPVVYANPSFENLMFYNRRDAIGLDFIGMVCETTADHEYYFDENTCALLQAFSVDHISEANFQFKRGEVEQINCTMYTRPIFDRKRKHRYVIAVLCEQEKSSLTASLQSRSHRELLASIPSQM